MLAPFDKTESSIENLLANLHEATNLNFVIKAFDLKNNREVLEAI